MREVIERAQQVPGPGEYEVDTDSLLARQRRLADRVYAVTARRRRKPGEDRTTKAGECTTKEKRPEFSSIKDAIKRFSSDLAREPATELPEPALLCAEVLESGAARRTYQRRMFS